MNITDESVKAFTQYRRSQVAELRPWQSGDDMSGVSVSAEDAKAGSPKSGDMIARNPKNHADQWLVEAAYFADNFEPLAALPHLSQGAVSVKPLDISNLLRHAFISGFRANGGVVASALKEWPNYNPEGFPAYDRILAALSPAPVGVTDEMVLKFITTSRDEDAGYQNWTEAVTAGLNATLASHEPAPTDTQEGKELGYDAHGKLTKFDVRDDDTHEVGEAVTNRKRAEAAEARILELEADLEVANDLIRKKDEALRNIRELNLTRPGADGLRWARSDLIEQEIVFALGGQSNE